MPASTSMTVALVLTAVNNMPSVLNSAGRNIQTFGSQVAKASEDVRRYDQRISSLEDSIKKFNNLKTSGLQDIQSGMAMLIPVEEILRQAAQFEGVMKKVENAVYDSTLPAAELQEQMKGLTAQAIELGNVTTFSNMEAAQAQLALIRNGMTYQDVLAGGATAAMYLAQTAEIAPSAAADAVSQITNMFQLQGNQLLLVADDINRAANASSAGVTNIMQDLQQVGMTANLLGLEVKDTTLLLGTLHNLGLGDSSGTYLNDMLINLDKITPKARKALQAMGWLEGATVKTLSSGNIRVTGGTNSLFDESGQIRSAEMLVKKLREVLYTNSGLKPEDMRDKAGNLLPQEEIEKLMEAKNKLEAMQQFKDVFGVQGMRAAIALATPGKGSYEEMVSQAERAQRIQDQVLDWQETLLGKVETLKGSWETIITQSGTPLTNEVGASVQQLTSFVNAIGDFANEHPKIVTGAIKIAGAFAIGKVGVGVFKYAIGTVSSMAAGAAKALTTVTRGAMGFYDTYKYFRTGTGVFRSIWSAVAFGHPTLTRIITTVGRLGTGAISMAAKVAKGGLTVLGTLARVGLSWLSMGAKALKSGARMAAAWLIGLGPVGWAIAGVTALVIAGIAAWKTNFGGFRDWCLGVLEKIMGVVNRVRTSLGMSTIELDILKQRNADVAAYKQMEYQKPPVLSPSLSGNADNRQYNFSIQSTDPKAAASEVGKLLGLADKYTRSRDPRLQTGFALP